MSTQILRSTMIAAALAILATCAAAEDKSKEVADCVPVDASTPIKIALCSGDFSPETLARAARAICEGVRPCGVWMWDDAEKMPAKAPENHDLLTPEQIRSALAVWDHQSGQLVAIRKVR